MSEFPYDKYNDIIFVEKNDFQVINHAQQIYLPTSFVSSECIKRILTNNVFYHYALKFVSGEINNFRIAYVGNGDILGSIKYTRNEIVEALGIYIKQNSIKNEEMLLKYQILTRLIDFEALKKKYFGKIMGYKIDNNDYQISTKDIFAFLEKSNYDVKKICDDINTTEIFGIPKEHFVYAVLEFIKDVNILDNYVLPSNVNLNIKDITNHYLDVEAINRYLETEDTLYKKIKLQEDLIHFILKDMPKNYTVLQKSIYIYIMLCKVLTYDEEFHALNEEGEAKLKHQDYHRVEEVNLVNNRVTCYEFNLIYAKFLDMLNIHFKSEYRGSLNEKGYGTGHANLIYRVNQYLILADSTERILEGDIANIKMNGVITGIKAINKNVKTQEEFQKELDMVYKAIELKDKKENSLESFDELISEYQKKTSNYKQIDFNTKIRIMLDKINNKKFVGVDAMAYLLQLRKIIFTFEEQNFNVKINIVANKKTINSTDLAMLSAIVRFNENDLEKDDTRYILFTPNYECREITFSELKEKFQSGDLSYLERDFNLIPRIEGEKKK